MITMTELQGIHECAVRRAVITGRAKLIVTHGDKLQFLDFNSSAASYPLTQIHARVEPMHALITYLLDDTRTFKTREDAYHHAQHVFDNLHEDVVIWRTPADRFIVIHQSLDASVYGCELL